ncbi:hypothetical protein GGS23DRAFT_614534 [Durotheca rogersii]|uniref:uncharacterized protein n=1 Tax=Durotheca rogersii TaxID=419775 RepID=UPI00221FC1F7|nr:uncharacterized protein GGS23DRAFT_614534 [Durotheca rogersii]KAI5860005.1 hypothetical protein GGS23DRAFT_614534 [Durotheca rogersii]
MSQRGGGGRQVRWASGTRNSRGGAASPYIRHRPYPPGPGNRLTPNEEFAMCALLAGEPHEDHYRSIEPDWSSDEEGDDPYQRALDPRTTANPDDPPLAPGTRNRTTVGVEFEFLLAVSPGVLGGPDPHPEDGRALAQRLARYPSGSGAFDVSVRNMIVDTLRRNGIVAVKSEEGGFMPDPAFDGVNWWDNLEAADPQDDPNAAVLDGWAAHAQRIPGMSPDDTVATAAGMLAASFRQFHDDHGLGMYDTRDGTIERIAQTKIPQFLHGFNDSERAATCAQFETLSKRTVVDEVMKHQREIEDEVDPIAVALPGIDPAYLHWTCITDASVSTDEALPQVYSFAEGMTSESMEDAYKWFNGELRSPPLDYNNPTTRVALRNACAGLRDVYRIHKPMKQVGTGLHVHFGQEAGWTLLHLKKFATLWVLLEQSLETLHRWDRSHETRYCRPIRSESPLAHALLQGTGSPVLSNLRTRDPHLSRYYNAILEQHLPLSIDVDFLSSFLTDFATEIWQFDTITGLARALSGREIYGHVRFRVSGASRSNAPEQGPGSLTQTLEVRIMQGTLDADHIWRWISIVERMLIWSRDTPAAEYRAGLEDMLRGRRQPLTVLGIPRDDITWFSLHRHHRTGYFEYPDRGRVDWRQPFMSPGHGDTYDWPSRKTPTTIRRRNRPGDESDSDWEML